MPKVAIDVDGVLANFTVAFTEVANKVYPGRVPLNFEPHDFGFNPLFSEAELAAIWRRVKATENFWLGMNPYHDSVMALARWLIVNQDQDVYLVTSRPATMGMTVTRQTDWWIRSCGIVPVNNYLGVIVVPDSARKVDLYEAGEFDYSIDDKGETVEQCDDLSGWHAAYLLDRPWNQEAKVKRRVKSLELFLKEIQ